MSSFRLRGPYSTINRRPGTLIDTSLRSNVESLSISLEDLVPITTSSSLSLMSYKNDNERMASSRMVNNIKPVNNENEDSHISEKLAESHVNKMENTERSNMNEEALQLTVEKMKFTKELEINPSQEVFEVNSSEFISRKLESSLSPLSSHRRQPRLLSNNMKLNSTTGGISNRLQYHKEIESSYAYEDYDDTNERAISTQHQVTIDNKAVVTNVVQPSVSENSYFYDTYNLDLNNLQERICSLLPSVQNDHTKTIKEETELPKEKLTQKANINIIQEKLPSTNVQTLSDVQGKLDYDLFAFAMERNIGKGSGIDICKEETLNAFSSIGFEEEDINGRILKTILQKNCVEMEMTVQQLGSSIHNRLTTLRDLTSYIILEDSVSFPQVQQMNELSQSQLDKQENEEKLDKKLCDNIISSPKSSSSSESVTSTPTSFQPLEEQSKDERNFQETHNQEITQRVNTTRNAHESKIHALDLSLVQIPQQKEDKATSPAKNIDEKWTDSCCRHEFLGLKSAYLLHEEYDSSPTATRFGVIKSSSPKKQVHREYNRDLSASAYLFHKPKEDLLSRYRRQIEAIDKSLLWDD